MNKSSLHCVVAHHGLGLHNSGRTYLCCHSRKYLQDTQGNDIYLDTHSLEDAWASPTRLEIQHALDADIEHPNCQACWDDEHADKPSRRMHFNKMYEAVEFRRDQPQLLDLKLGNVCNMKCRTCNPEVSSQWYREDWLLNFQHQLDMSYAEYLQQWRRIAASYSDDNHNLWHTLTQWLPRALYIDYYGGEPMLIKKNFEILEHAVQLDTAKDLVLHINTNGTVWSQYHERLLKNFKLVYFDISVDDIKSRCGYIRYSSDWTLVGSNIDEFLKVIERNSNFLFSVCVTVNSLNVYYLDEIFEYFTSRNLHVNPNMLHRPWQLNCKVLPAPVKEAVIAKLNAYVPSQSWDVDHWNTLKHTVTAFLHTPVADAPLHFEEFHRVTRMLDQNRNQSFEKILPEFATLTAPYFDQLDKSGGPSAGSVHPG